MYSAYYRNAAAVLLVYDITNKESFVNIHKWFKDANKYCSVNVICALVGNKSDLSDSRKVQLETAYDYAKEHDMIFTETSAKNDDGVSKIFKRIITELCEEHTDMTLNKSIDRIENFIKKSKKEETENNKQINCCY